MTVWQSDQNPNQGKQLQPVATSDNSANTLVEYDPYQSPNQNSGDIDLRELLRTIKRYKWTVFSVLTIFLVATLIATILMRPVYRATALVEARPSAGSSVVKFQNVQERGVLEKGTYQPTQVRIIESRAVARSVIDALALQDNPELTGEVRQRSLMLGLSEATSAIREKVSAIFNSKPVDESEDSEALSAEAAGNDRDRISNYLDRLKIVPVENSTLLEISFDSFDPKLSAEVANATASQYIWLSNERRFNSNSSAKSFLQKEIQKTQAKLETSEKDLTEFARKNAIVDIEDKGNIMTSRLEELSDSLTAVQTERIAKEAAYLQASEGGASALPEVLEKELIKTLKQEGAELQAEYVRLSGIYKEDYPVLEQLGNQISQIENSIASETNKIVSSMKASYEQLVDREELLSEALEKQKIAMLDLKDRSIQYNILKREWETTKELYGGLLERMKEVGVAAGMELDNISLIDEAIVPARPYRPSLFVNMALGGFLGLFIGLGLALLVGFLDNTIGSAEELERIAHVASLGIVPMVDAEELPEGSSLDLIAHQMSENLMSEAFRTVRTSLMFSSPGGLPGVLLVTSTMSSEGKSVSASNMALVLAQNYTRVLLVDCDLRRPRVHKMFKIPSSPGLSDYLTNNTMGNVIRRTELENLHVLTAGTIPPNPAELVGSEAMENLLKWTNDAYDCVILDGPPILGLADAVILSTKVDAVMMVVSAHNVRKDAVRESLKRLRMVRAPIIGAIMNRVDIASGSYGYFDNYYEYRASKEEDESAYG